VPLGKTEPCPAEGDPIIASLEPRRVSQVMNTQCNGALWRQSCTKSATEALSKDRQIPKSQPMRNPILGTLHSLTISFTEPAVKGMDPFDRFVAVTRSILEVISGLLRTETRPDRSTEECDLAWPCECRPRALSSSRSEVE
jgi:hypothetical protein